MSKFVSVKNVLGIVTLLVGNVTDLLRAFGVHVPDAAGPLIGQILANVMGLYLLLKDRGEAIDTPVPTAPDDPPALPSDQPKSSLNI